MVRMWCRKNAEMEDASDEFNGEATKGGGRHCMFCVRVQRGGVWTDNVWILFSECGKGVEERESRGE